MIIKCDAKALEWRSYLELSRDAVGVAEVFKGVDQHTLNQEAFNLPTRLISKVFLFRWIYRGNAFAYSKDPDFSPVSSSDKFWQNVIDRANAKYKILYEYQNKLIYAAQSGRDIVVPPTGRKYRFEPRANFRGELRYSEPDITNYVNQGFAADIMAVYRRILRRKIQGKNILFINTVHDDVQLDVDNDPELLYTICIALEDAWGDLHEEFYKLFNYEIVVPFAGEVAFGKNLKDLTKFDRNLGVQQYANPNS